jgi:PAS domain S-box-containing protein/putative nucleotidyltransferase with HDIG domain
MDSQTNKLARKLFILTLALIGVGVLVVRDLATGDDSASEFVLFGILACLIGFELVDRYRTERRLNREVAEGETRFRFAVEQTPAVVYLADPGEVSEWHYVSPYVQTLLGFSPEEWKADPGLWLRQVHPDDLPLAVSDERRILETGKPNATDYRIRTKAGEEKWVRDVSLGVMNHGRRVMQGVIYDITELKHAQEAARGRERVLRDIVTERTHEVERSRLEMMQRLAIAAELHEEGTREHTLRVGRIAARLAHELGQDPTAVELIADAAPLHDIGKLGVSNTILLKEGSLNPEEEATMRLHTLVGARILADSTIPALQAAEEIALTHHEHWDGTGYPEGLAEDDIPLPGRITRVADVFDALTHTRPYKQAWSLAEALEEIERGSGTRYDPQVVAALLSIDLDELRELTGTGLPPRGPSRATTQPA